MINKITIGGELVLSQENGYYIQEALNLGYSGKYSVSDILMKHGVKISNVLFKNKLWSVTVMVLGSDFSDLRNKRDNLFSYLTIDPYNEDDKIEFKFELVTGKSMIISGVVRDVNTDIKAGSLLATPVNFVIETEYPFLVSEQIYQIVIPISTGGGGAVPMTIPLDMSAGAAGYTDIINGGNVFAYPVYTITGDLDTPVLHDVDKDLDMSLDLVLTPSDTITIDTYNRTVLDQSGNNKLDKLIGDFLILRKGSNKLQLSSDGVGDDGTVTITWQYHYVSI